jgi:hypothetical protein
MSWLEAKWYDKDASRHNRPDKEHESVDDRRCGSLLMEMTDSHDTIIVQRCWRSGGAAGDVSMLLSNWRAVLIQERFAARMWAGLEKPAKKIDVLQIAQDRKQKGSGKTRMSVKAEGDIGLDGDWGCASKRKAER